MRPPYDTLLANLLPTAPRPRLVRRAMLWATLLALLGVAQTLLVALTIRFESTRAQDEVDEIAAEGAALIRRDMVSMMQTLQALAWTEPVTGTGLATAESLLRARRDLKRVEWRATDLTVTTALDSPYPPQLFSALPRRNLAAETEIACAAALRAAAPLFSRSYFVPLADGLGLEAIDLCIPVQHAGIDTGFVVATFALGPMLEVSTAGPGWRRHEFSFVEGDGTRLARAGALRGSGVYVAERLVDLPGTALQLRTDSAAGPPSLIPNLSTALVLGLSITLFGVVIMLARDVRRRSMAERALAEALGFRKAMEDSLSTGLRARDLRGAITYVNPAFCTMVGFTAEELRATGGEPPYWPPEFAPEYRRRNQARIAGMPRPAGEAREGYERTFMRKDGERFPVMIYEAPLVDGEGRHTGWMSAVLDLSAQRRVEEISRQQQDRLQATARLATVGEMASLLSHELNQPLAAIASYASGSLNLLGDAADAADAPGGTPPAGGAGFGDAAIGPLLRQALQRIAEQAERAGRVIKSVHDFVRRREQAHEKIGVEHLFEDVLPLARMQARKSGARIEIDLPPPPALPPRVRCDRTMVEQVLLNLARNGIQAMEAGSAAADRVLTLRARQTHPRWVTLAVVDSGAGIPPDVAARLFTPFYTTKAEGMGLGLSLCRTVIEQHGGALDFGPGPDGRGTEFHFTLPAAAPAESSETPDGGTALA